MPKGYISEYGELNPILPKRIDFCLIKMIPELFTQMVWYWIAIDFYYFS